MFNREVTQEILVDIFNERIRQDKKWGEQNHDSPVWLTVIAEELGEAAKALLELRALESPRVPHEALIIARWEELKHEITQTAACCVAWLEYLDRRYHA